MEDPRLGGGGGGGLNPESYFGAGGRYNMRRKSDCGGGGGGGGGGGMQIPDPSYFAQKKRNRSLDRTDELEDFAAQQHQADYSNAPPGLLQFQMMYQRRESAARGNFGHGFLLFSNSKIVTGTFEQR